jgi:hypothetical protein
MRAVAGEVEAVDVDQINRPRAEDLEKPLLERCRLVHVGRGHPLHGGAARLIPGVPDSAAVLWNGKHFDIRERAERLASGGDVIGHPIAGRRRSLEAQGNDIERAGQQPQNVVRPHPYPAVGRIRQCVAEKQKSRSRLEARI